MAPNPPMATIRIASFPRPSITILWAGSIDNAVFSSGIPKNMDGTNSIKACAIPIDAKNVHSVSILVIFKNSDDVANIIAPAVFTCIPGTSPVIVPHITPSKHAIIKSNNSIPP